jgi:hypothetical protein
MRPADLARLEKPYPRSTDGTSNSDFASALGLGLTNLRRLDAAIRGDLDFDVFGIGWWRTDDSETRENRQRRILVSDYLLTALEGVESNLVDLALHFLELQGAWEQESAFIRDSVTVNAGRPVMKSPQRTRPVHDLPHALVDMHTNGVFRASGSVLDCLAAVVIGVGALETNILRADWGALVRTVLKKLPPSTLDGPKMQLEMRDELYRLLGVGTADWDAWSNDYRNMLVHRGQRLVLSWVRPESHVVDGRGVPVVHAGLVQLLTRDPDLSEIEAFALQDQGLFVLSENARITITGIVKDVEKLVDELASYLIGIWERRRATPTLLPQPVTKQWPTVRRRAQRSFMGYRPGETAFQPSAMNLNPRVVDRLRAAGLGSDFAEQTWDGIGSIPPAGPSSGHR